MSDFEQKWFSPEGISEPDADFTQASLRTDPLPSRFEVAAMEEVTAPAPEPLRMAADAAPAAASSGDAPAADVEAMIQRLRREERREWLYFAAVVLGSSIIWLLTWAWYQLAGPGRPAPLPSPPALSQSLPNLHALVATDPLPVSMAKPLRPASPPVPVQAPAKPVSVSKDPLLAAYEHYSAGRLARAQRLYEQASRRAASRREGLLGLAMVALKQEHLVEAAAWYREILAEDPGDDRTVTALLAVYARMEPDAAFAAVDYAAQRHPRLAWWQYIQGRLALHRGDNGMAVTALGRAAVLRPRQADYQYHLAVACDRQGLYGRATDAYRRALNSPGPAGFDRQQVQRRLRELGPS